MAIQNRRGLKVDFDPYKMLPGEWAVSVDQETENQIIWMCFRAGVVKRMGTYEDFREQVLEIADDIREEFQQTINEIKIYMEGLKNDTEGYRNIAAEKAEEASASAKNAKNSEKNSQDYSLQSKSYAKGTGGAVRPNDDSDCAEFYYEQVKRISQGVEGIIPMGTITFEELALPQNQVARYMFDISDEFVTDERFKNGSGIYYGAGSNVIRTADDMWDVLAPTAVYGIKGDKEGIYRQGFVNLTPKDIGAATVEDLSGINADFVGTKSELEEKIAANEIADGVTVYLTDGGSSEENGGGEDIEGLQEQIDELKKSETLKAIIGVADVAKTDNLYGADIEEGLVKGFKSSHETTHRSTLARYCDRRKTLKEHFQEKKETGYSHKRIGVPNDFGYVDDWRYIHTYGGLYGSGELGYPSNDIYSLEGKLDVFWTQQTQFIFINMFITERILDRGGGEVRQQVEVEKKIGQGCIMIPTIWLFDSTFGRYSNFSSDMHGSELTGFTTRHIDLDKLDKILSDGTATTNLLALHEINIVQNIGTADATYDKVLAEIYVDGLGGGLYESKYNDDVYGYVGKITVKLPRKTIGGFDLTKVTGGQATGYYEDYYKMWYLGVEQYGLVATQDIIFGNGQFETGDI